MAIPIPNISAQGQAQGGTSGATSGAGSIIVNQGLNFDLKTVAIAGVAIVGIILLKRYL